MLTFSNCESEWKWPKVVFGKKPFTCH